MIEKISLYRTKKDQFGTHGSFLDDLGNWLCYTIERPWLDNQEHVSCIPDGSYKVKKFESPSKGPVFLILDVPGRTMIEIHIANHASELLGCIAVGLECDPTGVGHSALALEKLYQIMPDNFTLDIRSVV